MINREKMFGPGTLWRYRYGNSVRGDYYRIVKYKEATDLTKKSINFYGIGPNPARDPGRVNPGDYTYSVEDFTQELALVMHPTDLKLTRIKLRLLNFVNMKANVDELREMLVELDI
jgi:hypothetical protein